METLVASVQMKEAKQCMIYEVHLTVQVLQGIQESLP